MHIFRNRILVLNILNTTIKKTHESVSVFSWNKSKTVWGLLGYVVEFVVLQGLWLNRIGNIDNNDVKYCYMHKQQYYS